MTAKGRISRNLPERSTRQHRQQASLIITPSEGVEKSRELDTPSERVLPKSASEGVERAQKKVWHHNGTDSRNLLPLRQRGMKAMPSTRPAERVLRKRAFHNGTDSRNLLPLRQKGRRAMPPTRPVERVLRKRAFHNGTKGLPQRHRFAEFAAVAAKGQKGNAVYKACRTGAAEKGLPQRHRFADNTAVMEK